MSLHICVLGIGGSGKSTDSSEGPRASLYFYSPKSDDGSCAKDTQHPLYRPSTDQVLTRSTHTERAFHGYPLHRAVYDRLQLLIPRISQELLARNGKIRILSAPCGMAEDIFSSISKTASTDIDFVLQPHSHNTDHH